MCSNVNDVVTGLKFMDSPETRKSKYLENRTLFFFKQNNLLQKRLNTNYRFLDSKMPTLCKIQCAEKRKCFFCSIEVNIFM